MNKMREVCGLIGVPFEEPFTVKLRKCNEIFDLYADYENLYIVLPTGNIGLAGNKIWAALVKGEFQIVKADADSEVEADEQE